MNCPIDGAQLVMSERSGIEIDYCPSCRGVWLDRGELDKIIDRSMALAPTAPATPNPPVQPAAAAGFPGRPAAPGYGEQRYGEDRSRGGYGDRGYGDDRSRKRKKDNWLSELFD